MKRNACLELRNRLRSQLAAVRDRELGGSSICEPPARSTMPVAAPPAAIPIEHEILALLARPIDPRETNRVGSDRKERDLLALLDTLSAVEALSLSRRLANARRDDPLVAAFTARLSPERRTRVTAFLADTRRRIALRQAR